ncbi:uncharacterized protein METZ01_LOCUS472678, partial [marine metagenome]
MRRLAFLKFNPNPSQDFLLILLIAKQNFYKAQKYLVGKQS